MRQRFLAITLILTISLMLNFSEQVDAQPPLIVTIYTDKAVYAPGDDVNIKVEVREADASRVMGLMLISELYQLTERILDSLQLRRVFRWEITSILTI